MRIAIEIDNIIRDNNSQALKYFRKGYDNNFDEEVDLECSDLLSILPFKDNESRNVFKEIDYPYELFGCAKTCYKHLHVEVENWLEENEEDEIIYFALNESNLMIQSTYFFLSKGSRIRTVLFPKRSKDIWKYCDVAVTINEDVVKSKPKDKEVILIKKTDNEKLQKKVLIKYENLIELLKDKELKSKFTIIEANNKKKNIINLIKEKIIRYFKSWKK